jgi:hypothetical protein
MTSVSFPEIETTFATACNEVLEEYFGLGGEFPINSQNMQFYRTELHYNIDKVRPITYPRFCIVGSREATIFEGHCTNAAGQRCRVRRLALKRTAYLSMPRQGPIKVDVGGVIKQVSPDWLVMNKLWSQFLTVFMTQQVKFRSRGIINPRLGFSPVQGTDKEFLALIGPLDCNVEVNFVWE